MNKSTVFFLASVILSLFSNYVNANSKPISQQQLFEVIEWFPEFKEEQYSVEVKGYEYSICQWGEELVIYTYGKREAYDLIANYIMNRDEFKWKWKREGRTLKSLDFFGGATIINDDIKIEVRMGCWDCDGDKWDQYTINLLLID